MVTPTILLLSRVVSAVGILVHISLASSFLGTIALALLFEFRYLRGGDVDYMKLSRKFAVISTIIFGVGAAYGTLVEFGLVTVWSNFIALIGALALPFFLELFAFLFEVVVLPLYLYTWNKVKNGWVHFGIGLAAGFGGFWSAYNILAVMASLSMLPPGLEIVSLASVKSRIGGDITYLLEWQKPSDLFNMYWWGANVFIFHGIFAAVILSWSIVAGVYIRRYLRENDQMHLKFLKNTSLTIAFLTLIEGLVIGHYQGELVIQFDPLKLAALEGFFWSGLKVDPLISFVATGTFNHPFWGLFSWPSALRPPFYVTYAYIVMMVGFGIVLGILTAGIGIYLLFGGRLASFKLGWLNALGPYLLKVGQYLIPVSAAIASIGGALSAESGRFPLIFVSSVPNSAGPPTVTGIPVSAILNIDLSMPYWLAALLLIVELSIPFVAIYGIYLYSRRSGGDAQ